IRRSPRGAAPSPRSRAKSPPIPTGRGSASTSATDQARPFGSNSPSPRRVPMIDPAAPAAAYFGFTGMIEPGGVGRIAGALNSAVNSGIATVHLSFSSNGGYVADGIYLHNHIRALPLHLVIYNTGSVGSIAVSVFLAAHERYCSRHAMFMIHPTTMSAESMSARRLQSALDAALA